MSITAINWLDSIKSPDIKEKLQKYLADNTLTFDESKQILTTAEQGGMNATKFKDLNTLWAHSNEIFTDEYTKDVTGYVINGNTANAHWWGGLDDSGESNLGNLTATSSQNTVEKLIDKWFLGTDVPMPLVGGDAAAGISGDFKFSYAKVSGNLYENGVSASDVSQGNAGTCYYLACLGAIANANPSLITNNFIKDNHDGTYGFQFYNVNGEKEYVTVDTNIAVDSDGNPALAIPVNSELWVSLAEKAYAQLNSQKDVLIRDTTGLNSYQAVEGGNAEPLKQITGLNYSYYSGENENVGDPFSTETHYSKNPNTYKETIITLLKNGSIGWLGSDIDSKGANGKTNLVSGHAFMLLGYDASTDTFKIRNPWGGDGRDDYNPEFNLSLTAFWNGADIALTEPNLKNVDYVYTLTSNADSKTNAVVEGDSVNFSVSRTDKGTADIVYYSIAPISTNTDAKSLDHPVVTKSAIQFLSDTTTQNLSIPIFTDSLKEGVESFNVNLYKSLNDTVPFASLTNFITDGANDTNTYTITPETNTVTEGEKATFTLERHDANTEATVYISTLDGTATNGMDYAGINKQAVTFKANQKIATVTVDTYTDTSKEGKQSFKLDLYKYYADTLPSAEASMSITDAIITKDYEYTMSSDASTQATAKDEGSTITFTVKRNGTGTASTVYLKNEEGAALAGVDYSDAFPKELQFAPNQDTLTFTVDTFNDNQFESTEVFNLGLYKAQISDTVAATASAYIKNTSEKTYNYAITSDAPESSSAVEEGNDIIFTITRDGTGTQSTIYVDTFDGTAVGTANDWSNDFERLYEQEITFAPNETTKTVAVKTYADSKVEDIENLNLGLYQYKTDVEYTDYATAYVKDTIPDDYTYTVSSETVNAGEPATFTITRNSQGSESTVYLWTIEDLANTNDFEELVGTPLVFAADETTKIVTINTLTDSTTNSPIYKDFFLEVYKYYNDENYAAYGSATIANPLNEILGTAKNDVLTGTTGQDSIDGMEGNDKITGGLNQDVLTGGSGNDIFCYTSISDSLPNLPDIITDFTKGDKIDLSAIDANVDVAKDQAFSKPTIGAKFSGKFTKAGQLFFDTTDEILYGNVNKDGTADFAIQLNGVTTLTASDLVL